MTKGVILEGVSYEQLLADIRQMQREEIAAALKNLQKNNPSRLLNYREVQKEFGIKRSRLYDLHSAGALFYIKDGRKTVWRESDVRSYCNMLKTG